jgi:hypothetical protein
MAAYNINDFYLAFNVTGLTLTPGIGATYTYGGFTFTVRATAITSGAGVIYTSSSAAYSPALTISGSLTKATGTGDAAMAFGSVAYDARIDGTISTLVAGDTLSVYMGRRLLIDRSTPVAMGAVNANSSTPGEIAVINASTATPIVVTMNTQNTDWGVSYLPNKLTIAGDWITVATGTGAASQTINFTSVMGGLVDWPSCVWVETGDTRHKQLTVNGTPGWFMPFFNCGKGDGLNASPNYDVQNINILTDFAGDLEHGPVFQYDATTKVATFGKGGAAASSLGGAVIPNGARVLYPNIHFTSTVYDVTYTSRNMMSIGNGAGFNINICGCSRNMYFTTMNGCGDGSISNLIQTQTFVFSGNIGVVYLNNIAVAPDTSRALAASSYIIQISSNYCDLYTDFLWAMLKTTSTYCPCIQVGTSVKLKGMGTVWSWAITATTGAFPFILDSVMNSGDAPIVVGPVYAIGGQMYMLRVDNIHITELWHSDNVKGVASATVLNNTIVGSYAKNFSLGKIRKLPLGVAPRQQTLSFDSACVQYAVKDVVYDFQSNCSSLGGASGERGYLTNMNISNSRSALMTASTAIDNVRWANITSNAVYALGGESIGGFNEWILNTSAGYTSTVVYDGQPFQPFWADTAKSTAYLNVGPMSLDKNTHRVTVVSGVYGVDWYIAANALWAPNAGVELIFTNEFPIRGATDFSGFVTYTATSFATGATVEMSIRNNDDASGWTAWADFTNPTAIGNLITSLTNYSSALGFYPRLRLKTTTAVAGRVFNYGRAGLTPDSSWTPPEIGFIPITVTGAVVGSTVKMYDNTVPATPVRVSSRIMAASSAVIDLPYNFDATAKAFKLKMRKSGYGEVVSTGQSYQKGTSVPFSQIQYVAVNDTTASSLTGITVNGAAKTVTVSANHTLDELYAYCQWWSAQLANIDYEIPLTTTGGGNYSSTYAWSIAASVAITGTGAISLGAAALTTGAAATTAFNWSYNSGAGAWVSINVAGIVNGSRVQLYDVTSSTELYNGIPGTTLALNANWTADHTLRLRVTYASGVTAYLPYSALGTLTSAGAAFLVAQAADTVYNALAIDGSTCVEFVPDYPNLQIDVSDSDNITTVQRVYAWAVWAQSTAQGIALMFNSVIAQDTNNFKIDVAVVNTQLDNTKATPVIIGGGYLIRSDGTTIIAATSNSIQMDPGRAYVSPTAAAAIWATELETGFSASRVLRTAAAAVAGATSGGPTNFAAKNLSNTATQITGVATVTGDRTPTAYGS